MIAVGIDVASKKHDYFMIQLFGGRYYNETIRERNSIFSS